MIKYKIKLYYGKKAKSFSWKKEERITLDWSGRRFLFLHFQQIPFCTSLFHYFHYFCFIIILLTETSFSSRQYFYSLYMGIM